MEHRSDNLCDDSKPPGYKYIFNRIGRIVFSINFFGQKAMEWTKKNWKIALIIAVFNILLSGIVAFAVNAFSYREQALQGAASISYVDKQDLSTKYYIDSQDNIIVSRLDRVQTGLNSKADKDDIEKVWRLTLDNNQMLIEISAKIGIK